MSSVEFVRLSNEQIKSQNKEWYLFGRIFVYIKDPLPKSINIQNVIKKIEKSVPSNLVQEVDDVFIGHFEEFVTRDVNALYKDGAIYVSNNQKSDDDLVDDIVHEIAHAIEEHMAVSIYYDRELEQEFIGKRQRLFWMLKKTIKNKSPEMLKKISEMFLDPNYSIEFDKFLYKKLGYPLLNTLTAGLFISPYSITSLREYFASGFEEYFLKGNMHTLKKTCPILHKKLDTLDDMGHNS